MSTAYTCDWCGEEISSAPYGCAEMLMMGNFDDGWGTSSRVGKRHFHAGQSDDEDSCLRQALALFDRTGVRPKSAPELERDRRSVHEAWKDLDRDVKRGRVLTVLGNEGLSRRQIAERLPEQFPDIGIYNGGNELVPLLNEMLVAGELEREKELRTPGSTIKNSSGFRWRWRRSTAPLSPELQHLEQSLKEA